MNKIKVQDLLLSLLFPCIACAIQLFFWNQFQPFLWLLFYPAVFFSAQVGGRWGGMAATIVSAFLAIYFFEDPLYSFVILNPNVVYSVIVFVFMGILFSNLQGRFKREQYKLQESEAALRKVNEGLEARVTERALELQKTEARYRLISENAADVIWVLNPGTGKFTYISPSVEKLRGYTPEEVMAQSMTQVFTPHSLKMINENLAETLPKFIAKGKGTESFINQVDQPCKDGTIAHTEVTTTYVFNEDGEVEIVGVSRDITNRKRTEEALLERERKLSAILSLLPVGISILDQDRKLVYENQALEDILGITKEGLLRGDYRGRKYLRADGSPKPVEEFASTRVFAENKKLHDIVTGVVKEGGSIIWTNVNAIPVDFPDWKVVLVTSDITEHKQAEEEILASKTKLDAALSSMTDAVFISDVQGNFIEFNEAFATFHKFKNKEECAKTFAEYPNILDVFMANGELTPTEMWAVPRALRGEKGTGVEYGLRRKDTGETWVGSYSFAPIYDKEGIILGSVVVGRDITDRKHSEDELKRSNAELEQFAYVASHDLQEPLRAVAGMVQLLGQRYKGRLDESADEYIGHAVEASARMQKLINDLLDYSRVGRFGKAFELSDTEQLLNNVLSNLQLAIEESHAQITHDPLPTVLADSGQLIQVMQNLISNAIKFQGKRPPQIHIGAEKTGNNWRFSIRDNGIGIEPKYFERIYLVFQRLHTRREYPGTGIGLSLCKKIIERHGGKIWVESQLEHGSTFYFTIPEKKI